MANYAMNRVFISSIICGEKKRYEGVRDMAAVDTRYSIAQSVIPKPSPSSRYGSAVA